MVNWETRTRQRVDILLDQLSAWSLIAKETNSDITKAINMLKREIEDIYSKEMPLAKIRDKSDLVIHAEGPAAHNNNPTMQSFNWLCSNAEKQIRKLAKSIFNINDLEANNLSKNLDMRFSGFAPGSIYAGFFIQPFESVMGSDESELIYSTLQKTIRDLPIISNFITDTSVNKEIIEYIPDPAIRDAGLETILGLSPTGKKGIHTVDISSPSTGESPITTKERVILQDYLKKPELQISKYGKFVGDVREIDLDSGRLHIRNIQTIGTLRCVIDPKVLDKIGQEILNKRVFVEGSYEENKSGKPRLMIIDNIKPTDSQKNQLNISI